MRLHFLTLVLIPTLILVPPGSAQDLSAQLEQAVQAQQWSQAIDIVDQLLRDQPEQRSELEAYRSQLEQLAGSTSTATATEDESQTSPAVDRRQQLNAYLDYFDQIEPSMPISEVIALVAEPLEEIRTVESQTYVWSLSNSDGLSCELSVNFEEGLSRGRGTGCAAGERPQSVMSIQDQVKIDMSLEEVNAIVGAPGQIESTLVAEVYVWNVGFDRTLEVKTVEDRVSSALLGYQTP